MSTRTTGGVRRWLGGTLTASQAVHLPPTLIFANSGHFPSEPNWPFLARNGRRLLRRSKFANYARFSEVTDIKSLSMSPRSRAAETWNDSSSAYSSSKVATRSWR